jgi:hypothetical protein
VRRCLIALIVLSVFAFSTRASALHVHAYLDHAHRGHDHGPQEHEHAESTGEAVGALHVEACDPAGHVVRISYTASAAPDFPLGVADVAVTAVPWPSLVSVRVVRPIDVRGHSPPPSPFRQLRAPPS